MDTRAGNASQPPTKHSLRFDEHLKCFEFVRESLDQCREDGSLIAPRLFSPASGHLSTILELLWEIQRKESLVQLLDRGLDRHQSKTIPTSSTSLPPSEQPNSTTNDTELERRIQLGKLSIMWMRLHCLQALLADLAGNGDQQSPQWISSQRVLNRYFSLSPTSAHRTTSNPYLSRLMGSPTCAAAYIEAAHTFIKIWKALPAHLIQQSQTPSAPANKNFPIIMTQLNDLAKSLNITDTYSEPLDLIKPCAHALICQTLDWTLNAHRKAVSVTEKASLFRSRLSCPSANHKPKEAPRTESESRVASTMEPRLSSLNTKTPPRQVASPQRPITNVKTPVLSSSQCAPPEPQEAPSAKSTKQVAPTTQPQRPLKPATPSRQVASPRPLIMNDKTPIHPISQSAPSEPNEAYRIESEKHVAPTSVLERRVIEPPLNSKTPPRQVPSPQQSKTTNAAPSIHLTSRSVPLEPQEATPTSTKKQVAPETEPQRHFTEPPLHCKTPPRQVPPPEPFKTNVVKSIHLIPPSGPPEPQKATPTQSGKQKATASQPKQPFTEPLLSSKTPPRQVPSPQVSKTNPATSIHPISQSAPPEPQEAPPNNSKEQIAAITEAGQPVHVPVPPPNSKLAPREVAPLEVPTKPVVTSIRFISYSTLTRKPPDAPSIQLGPQMAPPTESERQQAEPVQILKASLHVPSQSPGDRSLPSSPPKRNAAGKSVSSIPTLARSSTPDAGQLGGHANDQNSSQIDNRPHHELTPPSQFLDGSLASSNTILSVCGIEGRVDINNSVTVRVSPAPAFEASSAPALKASSSPATKVPPAPDDEESASPDKRTIQPTSETSQACCSREGSKIQPGPLPTQIPSRGQTVGSNDMNRAAKLSPNKAQLNLNNITSFNKMRHSVGPCMEGSSSVTANKVMKMSSHKRKRRCTESGGHERRKRLQLETILESRHTQNLLKEFRDNPRLSKALQEATDIAIQNESRLNQDDIPPDSDESESRSDSEHGSLLDDTSAELDPALIEKLKANAAQFKDNEDSEFAKILSLADRDLRKRSAC